MFLFNHDEYRGLTEPQLFGMSEKSGDSRLRFLAVIFQIFYKISLTTRMLSRRSRGSVWEEFKKDTAPDVSRFSFKIMAGASRFSQTYLKTGIVHEVPLQFSLARCPVYTNKSPSNCQTTSKHRRFTLNLTTRTRRSPHTHHHSKTFQVPFFQNRLHGICILSQDHSRMEWTSREGSDSTNFYLLQH